MATYWEQLKDPRWQRKRLEVLNRENFHCEHCGSSEKTLHVHHAYYERGLAPWEYPDHSLHSLCEECHTKAQDLMTLMQRSIGRISHPHLELVYGFVMAVAGTETPDAPMDIFSDGVADGVSWFWHISPQMVLSARQEGKSDTHSLMLMSQARRKERERNG